MRFEGAGLEGAYLVHLEPFADDRGLFARTFCAREFAKMGLTYRVAQCNLSFNHVRGTLRGLHMQVAPAAESKFIRCISGAIYDVIVDMRPGSKTYRQHIGVELTAADRTALYVPEGFAHGYQALTDAAEVMYQVGEFWTPECEIGFRHDDPILNIEWPLQVTAISEKDASWPLLDRVQVLT
ncbi:MAG: dTDP-4-dehydrorhamnose 3,5-epimerase [Actinomycetota bacterium]